MGLAVKEDRVNPDASEVISQVLSVLEEIHCVLKGAERVVGFHSETQGSRGVIKKVGVGMGVGIVCKTRELVQALGTAV